MLANLAFVFPGQGSQSLGMLADLAAATSTVKAAFDEAGQGCGLDLWSIGQNGPEEELNRTEVTQPALLAAGVAVWRVWNERGGAQPAAFAGHSLGEYAALVAAGALSLADGAALVRERGRLMQSAVPPGIGAMAAILMADDAVIAQACVDAAQGRIVAPANFNSPGQTVIAGHADAVDRAIALLAERGVKKAVKLAVSVPSHSALMQPAADALRAKMQTLAWSLPDRPVIQNADAVAHESIAAIQDALVRQLHLPVRWTECVQALAARGVTRIGECGPGKVLAGLCKRIDKAIDGRALATDLDAARNDWR
ncbi:MAG TPA: ACP S-malonyltransferase [Pseudomonadota bacterium]|nr:ACP S-malonyltransferase [Pseudomonadota bacterium]